MVKVGGQQKKKLHKHTLLKPWGWRTARGRALTWRAASKPSSTGICRSRTATSYVADSMASTACPGGGARGCGRSPGEYEHGGTLGEVFTE